MKQQDILNAVKPVLLNEVINYDERPGYLYLVTANNNDVISVTLDIQNGLRIDTYNLIQDRTAQDDRYKLTVKQYEATRKFIIDSLNSTLQEAL